MFILDRIDRELHSLERLAKESFYALASSFMTFLQNFVAILTLRPTEGCYGNFVISHVKLQIIAEIKE